MYYEPYAYSCVLKLMMGKSRGLNCKGLIFFKLKKPVTVSTGTLLFLL